MTKSYNKRQMSRIYPKGTRVGSENYMPQVSEPSVKIVQFCKVSNPKNDFRKENLAAFYLLKNFIK